MILIPSSYAKDKAITYQEIGLLYKKKLEDNLKFSRIDEVSPDGSSGNHNHH